MRVYYVYMLRCFDGTFYTGVTNDVVRRYERLAYAAEFPQVHDAIAWEKRLKVWTHKKKRAFAEQDWPLLKRLSAGT
jgi:putative endonuclease